MTQKEVLAELELPTTIANYLSVLKQLNEYAVKLRRWHNHTCPCLNRDLYASPEKCATGKMLRAYFNPEAKEGKYS